VSVVVFEPAILGIRVECSTTVLLSYHSTFCHFLYLIARGGFWTCNLRNKSRVFYHCATWAQTLNLPDKILLSGETFQNLEKRSWDRSHKSFWAVIYNPGANLIKLFWSKFFHTFCKLDHFINIGNILGIFMKRSSLQNRVSKFMPKSFMRLTPWMIS
jgi:hypothetical protein